MQLSDIAIERIKLARAMGKVPSNVDLIASLSIEQRNALGSALQPKPTRSSSGVNVVAIMAAPIACPHGRCTYCPGGPGSVFGDVPQSYTGNEPASMRAKRGGYDAYVQVMGRLEQYAAMDRLGGKVELIIMGGTFPSFPKEYQDSFVRDSFAACNDFSRMFMPNGILNRELFNKYFELPGNIKSADRTKRLREKLLSTKTTPTLVEAQLGNELAAIRIIALCVETKPDWCLRPHVNTMLEQGATRVELGVQTLYEEVLRKTNRGHTLTDTYEAFSAMKDAFLKVGAHMMPGQPGSTPEMDSRMLHDLFEDKRLRPDALKIYPCIVMPGTPLYAQYRRGEFTPMRTNEAASLIADFKPSVPKYCRIMRIQRDIPTKLTADGVDRTNLRQYVQKIMLASKTKCKCIRCREPRGNVIDWESVHLERLDYEASGGSESFISFIDKTHDFLLGYCRVRLPSAPTRPEITGGTAGIRELHVFGDATPVGALGAIQHRGLGQRLVKESERIAKEEFDAKKLLVIAGVGARDYYRRKLGYHQEGVYLEKDLK